MARIAGVNIPQNKVLHVALTYIHGVGDKFSNEICTKLNIPKKTEQISFMTLQTQMFYCNLGRASSQNIYAIYCECCR